MSRRQSRQQSLLPDVLRLMPNVERPGCAIVTQGDVVVTSDNVCSESVLCVQDDIGRGVIGRSRVAEKFSGGKGGNNV